MSENEQVVTNYKQSLLTFFCSLFVRRERMMRRACGAGVAAKVVWLGQQFVDNQY